MGGKTENELFISDELKRLHDDGYGVLVERQKMVKDKIFDSNNCFCAFIKNDIHDIGADFFRQVRNSDCNKDTYEHNYDKSMELSMKKVAVKYCKNTNYLALTMELNLLHSNIFLLNIYL